MMETEQKTVSSPSPGQTVVRTWLSSSTRGAPRTPSDPASRFSGDGVRYRAKLIGVDPVPYAQGDKMCWDSMMKLKGCEEAARRQGKHKLKVWLKISSSGLKVIDERTGAILYEHDRSKISSWRKDYSDPRALSYIYQHQDTYSLFYIKMAYLADPVLADIEKVCQDMDQETLQEPAEAPTQTGSILLLNNSSEPPAEGSALEDVFSPRSPTEQTNQVSFSNQLIEVFSIPMTPKSSCVNQGCQPESPQPTLSNSQILSIFPNPPVGGCTYSPPPCSPNSMPWGQQGLVGNQWAGPAVAPWPTIPVNMPVWAPTCGQSHGSQPGVLSSGNAPASPTAVSGYPTIVNNLYAPAGTTGPLQSTSSTMDQNLLL